MVQSETEKDRLKKILGNLVTEKCIYMEKMIKGYSSMEDLRVDTISILDLIEYFEEMLKKQIQSNDVNIYFLKFSSLMKAYILFDPIDCRETESALEDIINRDKCIDQTTTITSISILQGNVGSIIASFKNPKENGKILKFSEKIPQIFNYNKGEFQTKERVTDLIPECIGKLHDQFLQRLIQTGIAKTVRTYRTMFGKDKSGYIFRLKLFINFYFVKQDDFAFSSLIVNCPSNDMYVLLNSGGYIEGISYNFAQLINATDVDQSFYSKLNISALIPQFLEFMADFNLKEEYSFLKFKLDAPKDMGRLIQSFMHHHSNSFKLNISQSNGSQNPEWKKNLKTFVNTKGSVKEKSYEITLNVRHELFSDNGQDILLYILEIQSYIPWDEVYMSEYSVSTGGRSKNTQKSLKDEQQFQSTANKSNTIVKNLIDGGGDESKNDIQDFSKNNQDENILNSQNLNFTSQNAIKTEQNKIRTESNIRTEQNNLLNGQKTNKSDKNITTSEKNIVKQQSTKQQQVQVFNKKDENLIKKDQSKKQHPNLGLVKQELDPHFSQLDQTDGDLSPNRSRIDSCDNIGKKSPTSKLPQIINMKHLNYAHDSNLENLDDSNMPMMQNRKYDEQILDTINVNNTLMTTQQNDDDHDKLNRLSSQKTNPFEMDGTITFVATNHNNTSNHNDNSNIIVDNSTKNGNKQHQENLETMVDNSNYQGTFGQNSMNQQPNENAKKDDESSANASKDAQDKQSITIFEGEEKKKDQTDLVRQIGRNNDLPLDQGSKSNSVISSSQSIIKHIITNTTSKQTPPFISILYAVFIFQFFVFITVVIVISVTISNSLNNYTKD